MSRNPTRLEVRSLDAYLRAFERVRAALWRLLDAGHGLEELAFLLVERSGEQPPRLVFGEIADVIAATPQGEARELLRAGRAADRKVLVVVELVSLHALRMEIDLETLDPVRTPPRPPKRPVHASVSPTPQPVTDRPNAHAARRGEPAAPKARRARGARE